MKPKFIPGYEVVAAYMRDQCSDKLVGVVFNADCVVEQLEAHGYYDTKNVEQGSLAEPFAMVMVEFEPMRKPMPKPYPSLYAYKWDEVAKFMKLFKSSVTYVGLYYNGNHWASNSDPHNLEEALDELKEYVENE